MYFNAHMLIIQWYVQYDYVQCCDVTLGGELIYMNFVYYSYFVIDHYYHFSLSKLLELYTKKNRYGDLKVNFTTI